MRSAAAKRLLTYYNDYFGQPYPLPKLDMIAGPGSSQFFGAMENWGAIFYFEPELLFDPKRATESDRQRIFTVVAHEMAHQWFGDLVTMSWWDDLWLNEGFASWMENKAAADLNPDWYARRDRGRRAIARRAMGIDATAATHPIIRHVETVDQIGEAFDGITYQKGQAVIGMIEVDARPGHVPRRHPPLHGEVQIRQHRRPTSCGPSWRRRRASRSTEIAHDFTLQGGVPLVTLTGATCVGGTTAGDADAGAVRARCGVEGAADLARAAARRDGRRAGDERRSSRAPSDRR